MYRLLLFANCNFTSFLMVIPFIFLAYRLVRSSNTLLNRHLSKCLVSDLKEKAFRLRKFSFIPHLLELHVCMYMQMQMHIYVYVNIIIKCFFFVLCLPVLYIPSTLYSILFSREFLLTYFLTYQFSLQLFLICR